MKRKLLTLVLLITTVRCSLFKNTRSTNDKLQQLSSADTELKQTEEKNLLVKSAQVRLYEDSGAAHFTIQIWPRGAFTYSAENGFSGEAERIQVEEAISNRSSYSDRSQLQQRDKGKLTTTISAHEKSATVQQVKMKQSSPSWKLIIGGLAIVLVLGVAWFLYHQLT